MSDIGKFKHGSEGTHYACPEQMAKMGLNPNKTICCGCTGHKCMNNTETVNLKTNLKTEDRNMKTKT